jgi:hypothetical protein
LGLEKVGVLKTFGKAKGKQAESLSPAKLLRKVVKNTAKEIIEDGPAIV